MYIVAGMMLLALLAHTIDERLRPMIVVISGLLHEQATPTVIAEDQLHILNDTSTTAYFPLLTALPRFQDPVRILIRQSDDLLSWLRIKVRRIHRFFSKM